jgi:HEPN domain-containing protein
MLVDVRAVVDQAREHDRQARRATERGDYGLAVRHLIAARAIRSAIRIALLVDRSA